jgi:hypothetical protein
MGQSFFGPGNCVSVFSTRLSGAPELIAKPVTTLDAGQRSVFSKRAGSRSSLAGHRNIDGKGFDVKFFDIDDCAVSFDACDQQAPQSA